MEVEFGQPTIQGLLSAAYQYQIPLYQRAYEWEARQIDDLWADILNLKGTGAHFIGSVVVHKTTDKGARQVIDGQQRLITLLLVVSLIRDTYLELGDPVRDPASGAAKCSEAPGQLIKKVGYKTDYTLLGGQWNRGVLEDFVYRLPADKVSLPPEAGHPTLGRSVPEEGVSTGAQIASAVPARVPG